MSVRTMPVLAAVASLVLVTGCAQSARKSENWQATLARQGYEVAETVDEIRDYRINGWNRLDDQRVIFDAGPSRDFLITLTRPCRNLRSAEIIGFTSTGTSVTNLDKLVARSNGFTDNCPIRSIQRLNREASGTE